MRKSIMRPVYMITGFLESGKSEFITYTLEQDYFRIPQKTLLILCEEGEVEYDKKLLDASNTVVELVENEEDMNPDFLTALDKKHKPARVIVEFNGMWNYRNMKLPWFWKIEQQITTIDASSFKMYYSNMKSLLGEMIKKSDLIIFNRCDSVMDDLSTYRRNVMAVVPKAEIVFEDSKGEVQQMFEEDLPYNLNDDPIVLDDMGFALFFIDSMSAPGRYVGKNIKFLAQVMKPENVKGKMFVPARFMMNCCAQDIAPYGYMCEYDQVDKYKEKDWVTVTAHVKGIEVRPEYNNEEGLMLKALSVEPAQAPAPNKQVINLTG